MRWWEHWTIGWQAVLSLENLLYCFVGVSIGTLVGLLPGLGPVATIAMLLPITYSLSPRSALILLAGIYYGAQYGGSTAAILLHLPGRASALVTCMDGYQMARRGRAGVALTMAAVGSFLAGTFATLLIFFFAQPLQRFALGLGAPEYLSLMILGLVGAVVLAQGDILRALGMIFVGVAFSFVGMDLQTGRLRYTAGIVRLMDGLDLIVLIMGIYGISEVMLELMQSGNTAQKALPVGSLWPSKKDWKMALPAMGRGSVIGAILGLLPGGGALLSTFASYAVEKKLADPHARIPMGEGHVAGLAAPEAANNSGAQTSFIPMLTLGIPSNAVMALMIGAFLLHGITPGPQVMRTHPDLFWGLIISMWLGNFFLLILNLPLIRLWVTCLRIPYQYLYPLILACCAIGVYSLHNSVMDVYFALGFAILAIFLQKWGCEMMPLLLGFLLGPMIEENWQRTLLLETDWIEHPIALGVFFLAFLLLVSAFCKQQK